MKKLTILTLLMFISLPLGVTAKAASFHGTGFGTSQNLESELMGDYDPPWTEENFENLFFEEEPLSSLSRMNAFHWARWMLGELEEVDWQNPENRPPGLNFSGWNGIGSPVTSAVPVPGAGWLLGTGLIGLVGFRLKNKK